MGECQTVDNACLRSQRLDNSCANLGLSLPMYAGAHCILYSL